MLLLMRQSSEYCEMRIVMDRGVSVGWAICGNMDLAVSFLVGENARNEVYSLA